MAGFRRRSRFRRRTRRFRVRRFIRKVRRISRATIRRMSEVKWATASYNSQSQIPNLPSFNEISPSTAQGTNKIGQRVGNRIKYKYLTFDASAFVTSADSVQAAGLYHCRLAIVSYRIANPSFTDISGSAAFNAANIWLPFDGTVVHVWKDWKFTLSTHMTGSPGQPGPMSVPVMRHFRFRKRLRHNVEYRSNVTEQPQDPHDKFIVLWGFNSGDPNASMIVNHWTRISYIDI